MLLCSRPEGPTVRTTRRLGAALALALVLTACSGGADDAPVASSEPTAAQSAEPPAPASTPSPTPTEDPLAACERILDGGDDSLLSRIPDVLTSIGASMTQDQMDELIDIELELRLAEGEAPDGLERQIERLAQPFREFTDLYAEGGGELNMDTSHVFEDITAVMETCVDAGFKVN